MAEYWSGKTAFTGFATQTDFNSIIDATVKMEKFRYNQLSKEEAAVNFKKEQINDLNNTFLAYNKQLKAMDTVDEFMVRKVTSSESSIVSATAKAGAIEGTHTVNVEKLATTATVVSDRLFTSATEKIATGPTEFIFSYAGADHVIDVTAETTISQLMGEIEASTGGKVKARLINVGASGSRLQLRGMDQGGDNEIKLLDRTEATTPSVTSSGQTSRDILGVDTVVTKPQNAVFTVDGVRIERQKNVVDDVIENVSLNLNDAQPSKSVTIKVATDYDAIVANIEKFVALTNELRENIKLTREYQNDELDKKGLSYSLKANPQIKRVESQLKNILASSGVGFVTSGPNAEDFSTLSALGVRTISDENSKDFGKLEFDQDIMKGGSFGTDFMTILKKDPNAVAMLFAANGQGSSSDKSVLTFNSSLYDMGLTKAGNYVIEYNGGDLPDDKDTPFQVKIDGVSTEASYNKDTGLLSIKEGDVKGLAVQVNATSDEPHSATISIKEGKVQQTKQAIDTITDSKTGVFNIMVSNFEEQIDDPINGLKRKMADELTRVEALEKRLILQYSRAETLLSNYKNQQSMLDFQLKSQLKDDD